MIQLSNEEYAALVGERDALTVQTTALGGVLVRRGHATSKRIAINANETLTFYWITEAGRNAFRKLTPAV